MGRVQVAVEAFLIRLITDTLMINRTISGQYWNLIHLKVHDNFNQLFEEFVPLQNR